MIEVTKGSLKTNILEEQRDKYLAAGWKETKPKQEETTDEAAKIIEENIDKKKAADNRKKNVSSDAKKEAAAIVATELKPVEPKEFTDNLIKEGD